MIDELVGLTAQIPAQMSQFLSVKPAASRREATPALLLARRSEAPASLVIGEVVHDPFDALCHRRSAEIQEKTDGKLRQKQVRS